MATYSATAAHARRDCPLSTCRNQIDPLNPPVVGALNSRISQDVDMVTLRLNCRFGGYGAPIAARY
jgi:outer membrane immunogenic protein